MAEVEPCDVKVESRGVKVEDQANNNNVVDTYNNNDDTVREENDCEGNDESNNNAVELDEGSKTNLIVNYLPQEMTDEEFEDLFKKFGEMKSCKIVRNRVSGYSYGFGFVDFQTHEQALKAITELNGHELETKKIKVAFARPAGQDIKQANLYIKPVPNNWTQEDVKRVFEPYGNIIQVRVLGNDRGVAFVLYDLRKQAEDALEALNGKTVPGNDKPFEIKFAADKKSEKGGSGGGSGSATVAGAGGGNKNSNNSSGRTRGHRGGRNQNQRNNRDQRQGRQSNRSGSFFDRQNSNNNNSNNFDNNRQQQQGMRGNQYNAISYGGGAQYPGNFNNMNGVGPMRPAPTNRMNRYAPFIPVQQPIVQTQTAATVAPMATQLIPNPAYSFPAQQQQMIPFAMMPTQQMAPMQAVNQPGQMATQPTMAMYGTPQMQLSYAPMPQAAMNNIYSVASNNMNNAANMQPQIGQPMTMRAPANNLGGSSGFSDDGVTLFVYNIGPDADENELRSLFNPYGQVVKCNVVRKAPGGETKGFGFVTVKDRDQANAAISGLNGSLRNGRTLQVSLKK